MRNIFNNKHIQTIKKKASQGFILPFTMLISTLVLLVSGNVLVLLSKQLYFSKIYRQSQLAYYAADDAMSCALAIDDAYIGPDGLGIFPYSTTTDAMEHINNTLTYINFKREIDGLPQITDLNEITCARSPIFTIEAPYNFTVSTTTYYFTSGSTTEDGITVSYNMRMPLGDGTFRCAKVTVNKTPAFRQFISQGYAQCDNPNGTVERAVVNTTIAE